MRGRAASFALGRLRAIAAAAREERERREHEQPHPAHRTRAYAPACVVHLDEDMKRVVREQSLGFVATVCPDGSPNLSPKGTTMVWDDEHLAFLHLYSPGTVANLAVNPGMEVNIVDPIVRKGYRFKGRAEVFTEGPEHEAMLERIVRERGTDPARIHGIVLMRVDSAAALISPAYELGETEASLTKRWLDHFTGLAARRLPG